MPTLPELSKTDFVSSSSVAPAGGTGGRWLTKNLLRYPTTVIAKRQGYGQCGVLVPNP